MFEPWPAPALTLSGCGQTLAASIHFIQIFAILACGTHRSGICCKQFDGFVMLWLAFILFLLFAVFAYHFCKNRFKIEKNQNCKIKFVQIVALTQAFFYFFYFVCCCQTELLYISSFFHSLLIPLKLPMPAFICLLLLPIFNGKFYENVQMLSYCSKMRIKPNLICKLFANMASKLDSLKKQLFVLHISIGFRNSLIGCRIVLLKNISKAKNFAKLNLNLFKKSLLKYPQLFSFANILVPNQFCCMQK